MPGGSTVTTVGIGAAHYVGDQHMLYGTSHSFIVSSCSLGTQVQVQCTETPRPGQPLDTIYTLSQQRRLLAYVSYAPPAIQLLSLPSLAPQARLPLPAAALEKAECESLAFSADGHYIAVSLGLPVFQATIWCWEQCAVVATVVLQAECLGRLTAFFPHSPHALCFLGAQHVHIAALNTLLASVEANTADVDCSALQEREVLLSHCWLAGGSLLLGTSKGRILTVAGAAPSTPLLRTWGKQPALKAEARCDLSSQLNRHGAVMALGLIDAHLVAFFTDAARGSGGADAPAGLEVHATARASAKRHLHIDVPEPSSNDGNSMSAATDLASVAAVPANTASKPAACQGTIVWLRPEDLGLARQQQLPVPHCPRVSLSAHQRTLTITGASGDVRVVDLALPAEESASARTRFASAGGCHDGSICGLCVSDGLLVSGGADGTVRAWDISRSKDSNTEAVQLQSIWRLSTPVIKARPIPDSQLVAVATQDGAVYILDTQQSHLPGLTTSSSTASQHQTATPPTRTASQQAAASSPASGAALPAAFAHHAHTAAVSSLAVSACGTCMASLSTTDGTLMLYKLRPARVSSTGAASGLASARVSSTGTASGLTNAASTDLTHMVGASSGGPSHPASFCTAVASVSFSEAQSMAWAPRSSSTASPQLFVATQQGNIHILHMPSAVSAAAAPQSSPGRPPSVHWTALVHSTVRTPLPVSTMVITEADPGSAAPRDSAPASQLPAPDLWMYAVLQDKSLRRYRITAEDVQRGQKDIVYMRSEKDVTSDIQKPVCSLVLSPTEDDLAVASADGCIAIYSLPELKLQSYSALHSGVAGGASDVAFLSDSTVASSGFDGLIQLVRMPRPDDAFRDDPPKLLWPPAKQLPQETVIAAPVRPQEGATGSSALPGPGRPSAVPAARSSTQQATAARLAQLRQRLRRVARQNDAADESEQLTEAELLINHSLRARLEAAGEKHIQQVRAELLHHRLADQLATERVRALVWDSAEVPAARIQALADRCVAAGLSCLDAPVARPPILACHKLEAVESYAELRESAQQWRRFDQVKFLRDMEQLEWQERPAWERGKLSGLSKEAEVETPAESIADEDENVDPEMPAAPLATSPTDASALLSSTMAASAFAAGTQRLPEAAEEQADTTDRGGTGVLYGWAEVHTPLRKTMQIILLQREARLCRQRFNAEFGALQEQKRKVLVQVDARVGRILDIHAELADTPGTPGEADAQKEAKPPDMIRLEDDEKPSAVLEVQDREVLAPKVLTAAEQASALEDERLTEAARLRGEQDEAARRALSDMMGGKLARPLRQDAAQAPEREPWMSVPAHLLTLGQQDAMRAFEARLQDYYEVQERRRRQLQADIKGLRIEIEELCVAFDLQLLGLLGAKMRSTACLALLELQAVRLAGALQHDLDTSAQLAQLGQQLAQVQQQQAARKPLLAELRKAADRAMAHEEELGHQYKLVERAFRKEYSNRSDFAALLAVLHERGHAATFHVDFRVKSVEELLGIAGTAAAPLRASPSEVDSQGSSPSRQGTAAPARPHSTLKAVSKTVALLAKFTRRDNPPGAEAGPQLEYQFLPLSLAGLLPSHAEGSVFQPSPMHHSAAHTNSGTRGPGLQHQLSRLPSSAAEASSSASSAATLEARRSAGAEASTSASLWTFENKPDNVGADVWLRLIELRNLRFSLESDLQATSVVAEVLTEQLQDLEDKEKEQTSTTKRLHQEIASLHSDAAREAYNLDVFLFLKQGQVEVLSANLVPDYSDAVLLDRAAIEELNGIIVSEAGANTGIVRQLQRQRRQMALAQWQNKAADLIMAHRQEDIKEIQLTHLTRDMPLKAGLGPGQARAGDSRIVETPRGKQQEARSEALLAAARKLHGGKIGAVSDRYLHITKEVVRHERQNQEVAQRTQAAAQMLYETRRVQQATNARRGERHTSQQECMQIITASSELSLIAKAQQEELEYFRIEAQRLQRRSYPTFAVPHVIAPDLSYDHHRV